MTHAELHYSSRGVALDQEKTRLRDQHMKGPGVSHDVLPYPQLSTTITRFVGSRGEHPKAATRTCNLPSASRLLGTHDGNPRLVELVSEIDRAARTWQEDQLEKQHCARREAPCGRWRSQK